MKTGIDLIRQERKEQIAKHQHTIYKDVVKNSDGQLRVAAIMLLLNNENSIAPQGWDINVWKKMLSKPYKDRLILAAALIAAEIDRYQIEQLFNSFSEYNEEDCGCGQHKHND